MLESVKNFYSLSAPTSMSSVHQRQLDDNDWPSWSDWVTLPAPGDDVAGHVTAASDDVTRTGPAGATGSPALPPLAAMASSVT